MMDQLKVGDVVLVQCDCAMCQRYGAPDPSAENGPYIITAVYNDGTVSAKFPFSSDVVRHWRPETVQFRVV